MRDPRYYRPASLADYLYDSGEAPTAPIVEAAAPAPSIGSRLASLATAPVRAIAAPFNFIGDQLRIGTEAAELGNDTARARLQRMQQENELNAALLPAQEAQAQGQVGLANALDAQIAQTTDPRLKQGLLRLRAGGPLQAFDALEPTPVEVALHENVLGMTRDQAREAAQLKNSLELAREQHRLGLAEIAARGAEDRRTLEAKGPEAPKLSDANALRGQYLTETRDFTKYRDAASGIELAAQNDTGAGNVALVYNFIKLLDPNAVKEGEYALTETASQTIPEKYRNDFKRLIGNSAERLSTSAVTELLAVARPLFKSRLEGYRSLRRQFGETAARGGFRPEDVALDLEAPASAPSAPSPNVGPEFKQGAAAELARRRAAK